MTKSLTKPTTKKPKSQTLGKSPSQVPQIPDIENLTPDLSVKFTFDTLISQLKEKPVYMQAKPLFGIKKYFRLYENFQTKTGGMVSGHDFEGQSGSIFYEDALFSYLTCGYNGKYQLSTEGKVRWMVYNCNRRHECPRCAQRYSYGKARNLKTVLRGILRSKAHSALGTPVFTIPKKLSEAFHGLIPEARRDIVNRLHKSAKQTLERVFKVGVSEDSKLAIATVFHSWSSSKPWKPHYHIHAFIPSVYLQGVNGSFDRAKLPRSGFIPEKCLSELKEVWKERLKENLAGYYPASYQFPEVLDVYYRYVPFELNNEKSENKISHRVNYALRSQLEDMWASVYKHKEPRKVKRVEKFPKDRIRDIGQIYESHRLRGERIRYYGFWSKSTRKKYLSTYFGLKLISEQDQDFEVDREENFIVVDRSKNYLLIKLQLDPPDLIRKLDRWDFEGENSYISGQVWVSDPSRAPP